MSAPLPTFLRRTNRYGTTDSICNACFAVIATAVEDTDLDQAEQFHVCDPEMLAHWSKLVQEIERSGRRRRRRKV